MSMDMETSVGKGDASLNAIERVIAMLWKEVLEVPGTISPTDNFFQLGGDSIGMVTVLFRVQEELSIELSPEAMFAAPTLRELAALVDATSHSSQTPST